MLPIITLSYGGNHQGLSVSPALYLRVTLYTVCHSMRRSPLYFNPCCSRPVTASSAGKLRKPKELLVSRLRPRPEGKPARIQPTKFRFGVRNTFDREFTKIRDSFETRKTDTILDRLSDFFQPISRLMSQWKWSVNIRGKTTHGFHIGVSYLV